jgi:hypothetical protein
MIKEMAYVATKPLTWPSTGRPQDSLFERCCMWMPIVGWFVGAIHWQFRSHPIVRHIDQQLEYRNNLKAIEWSGDTQRQLFGRWLSHVIAQEMTWTNDRFLEDDPIEILCWSHDDGLDFDFVLQAIDVKIGRKLSQEEADHLLSLTLGEAVDYLLLKTS